MRIRDPAFSGTLAKVSGRHRKCTQTRWNSEYKQTGTNLIRMRAMIRRPTTLLAAFLAAPLIAACGTEATSLPPGLGPVANVTDVTWPAQCGTAATDAGAVAIGPAVAVLANPSFVERQARACVKAPIAAVWQALQIPTGIDVGFWPEHTESDCEAQRDVETGYAVSFMTREIPHGGIQSHYTFDVTWRADVTQGTAAAPTELKMLYGKTAGTVEVPWIRGSMVFTPDPVNPGWTRIEMVRQLNTNGHSDEAEKLQNWLTAFQQGLSTQLSTGALTPRFCNL
jgi:hypothetical protein